MNKKNQMLDENLYLIIKYRLFYIKKKINVKGGIYEY